MHTNSQKTLLELLLASVLFFTNACGSPISAKNILTPTPTNTRPAPTMTRTPTVTPTYTPTPKPLNEYNFLAFHDYNGNGLMDEDEPPISGIEISPYGSSQSCITNQDGLCRFALENKQYRFSLKDPSKRFRYILPYKGSISTENEILAIAGNNVVPLAEGFLTLPFEEGTPYEIIDYFDYDKRSGFYLWWNGESGRDKDNKNNHFIVFRIPKDTKIVAPAPGIIVRIGGRDPERGSILRVETVDGLQYTIIGINYSKNLEKYIGSTGKILYISRGDYLGGSYNDVIYLNICEFVGGKKGINLRYYDIFSPDNNQACLYYKLIGPHKYDVGGETECSPGYWTVRNNPHY